MLYLSMLHLNIIGTIILCIFHAGLIIELTSLAHDIYHGHFKPDVISVVTSATAQGKQIKAIPLTMVHAPTLPPASSCRITKHLATLHIISHSPECPYHWIIFRSWILAYR